MILKNKVAFVTGGSRGIGKGVVTSLARNGYKVAFSYNSSSVESEKIVKEFKLNNIIDVLAVNMTIENRASVKDAISLVETKFGKIDILVNNAAISQEKTFNTITDNDWDVMHAVNLRGPFSIVQELIPNMVNKNWGRIINISSIGGQWGGLNQVHYAASKAALINFTQSIAKIYSENGVTSNAIAPGLIATDMSKDELNTHSGRKKVEGIPLKRLGTVEDVGAAVLYLASDGASYITGQTINLNGGMFFST